MSLPNRPSNPSHPGDTSAPGEAEPAAPQGQAARSWPFPTHRDLYLLAAGLLMGVLLSGAVLGRVSPSLYDRLFVGSGGAAAALQTLQAQHQQDMQRLRDTGVTSAAILEQQTAFDRDVLPLRVEAERSRQQHAQRLAGAMTALLLAMLAVMLLEPLVAPVLGTNEPAAAYARLQRLVTIRYALAGLWLTLAVAQPTLLGSVSPLFVALLVLAALGMAWVPLRRAKRVLPPHQKTT